MGKQKKLKEFDELQRLKYENKKLKKQISQLRKQLAKIDVDRYQNLKELVEAQQKEDKELEEKIKREKLKEKWKCYECKEGYLRLMIFHRPDGDFYYRRCTRCGHKTKLQRYNKDVDGILE